MDLTCILHGQVAIEQDYLSKAMKYIKVNNIKLNINSNNQDAINEAIKLTGAVDVSDSFVSKKSIDARKKPDLKYVYSVVLEAKSFSKKNKNATLLKRKPEYQMPEPKDSKPKYRPVIVGFGPAGMFLSLLMADYGFNPIIIERGENVEDRINSVNKFWECNILNTQSNVQFGEGGAGTFSDGKLNTGIKDKKNRINYVLSKFVQFGAPENIMYDAKPHIGTDILQKIVKNIRCYIESKGGTFYFNTQLEGLDYSKNYVTVLTNNKSFETNFCCLAIGNASRDTFMMLKEDGFELEAKPFAMGVRVEHKQSKINLSQYGFEDNKLGAAPYKLTYNASNGRGVYSFCMCPGGFVVNASSEKEKLCVNGMSYSSRDEINANSAIVVTINTNDLGDDPLSGVYMQQKLETSAYIEGKGFIPVQTYKDFKDNIKSTQLGDIKPNCKGGYTLGNLRNVLPEFISESIIEGMEYFGGVIEGFSADDVVMSGVESRTSSPVRIVRDENMQTSKKHVYAIGEGAGFAGGIVSSAVDGIKMFENYINNDF